MEFDVFISHSSKDKPMADAVCARLEGAGIRCWIAPRDIQPGKPWSGEIIDAIQRCRVMVLVFSSSANESPQILREVEAAVNRAVPVLPFRIEDILPSGSMAYFMSSVHWLDAISEPQERHLAELVRAAGGLLKKDDLDSGPTLRSVPVPPQPKPQPSLSPARHPSVLPYVYVAAAVVVLLTVGVLYYFLSKKPSGYGGGGGNGVVYNNPAAPANPTPAAPAPSSARGADTGLSGTWHLHSQLFGVDGTSTLTYQPGGSYTLNTVYNDSGTFTSGNGQFSTTSTGSGTVRSGTYTYAGPHTIKVTNFLGSAFYSPALPQSNLDPSNPIMLGTWQATTHPPASPPWQMMIDNRPDGTYTSAINISDHGTYTSANGQYTMTSQVTGLRVNGTYRSVDANTLETTGPLGTADWTKN